MSLISVRNFIAPFSNKVGIGALVVVTIIVAVARISGAHSNRSENGESRSSVDEVAAANEEAAMNSEIANFLKNQEVDQNTRARMKPSRENNNMAPIEDPVLSDLLRREGTTSAPQGRRPAQNNSGLSDIRRTLGLE